MFDATPKLSPLEAFEALKRFARRAGEAAVRLAMHAAVPQMLRPDLLHLLKANFVPEARHDSAAEADVLLSPICESLSGGYFQFDREIRLQLIDHLASTYRDDPMSRVRRVALFLFGYVEHREHAPRQSHDPLFGDYLKVQRWVAWAFIDPARAAEEFAAVLQRSEAIGEVAARLQLGGLASAMSIPLAGHPELLAYAAGLQALGSGEESLARALLERSAEEELVVGSVRLPMPRLPRRSRARPARETKVSEPEAPARARSGKLERNDWAIVVGIDHYPGLQSKLRAPEADAMWFKRWLIDGARVPMKQIFSFFGSDFKPRTKTRRDAGPTAESIQRAFDKLWRRFSSKLQLGVERLGRRLYIYMSGHGFQSNGSEPALLTANATRNAPHHIAPTLYAEHFRKAGAFEEIVLFMDCSREYLPTVPLIVPPYSPITSSVSTKLFYGLAARASGLNREILLGGVPRGMFTVALLEGLNGAATGRDGRITDRSLAHFVLMRVHDFRREVPDRDEMLPEFRYQTDPKMMLVLDARGHSENLRAE